jgi:2'-5' RNA ligase
MLRRTALIVAVPEAEAAVGALRLAHDPSAALGAPAHITILFPFAPPDEIDDDALREVFAAQPAFDFVLDRVECFAEGPVWLHPEPSEPFVALINAVWRTWPEFPPYEGLHDEPIPHLTVSKQPLEIDVTLPIAARASHVTLIEQEEPGGRWATRLRFPLGSGAG